MGVKKNYGRDTHDGSESGFVFMFSIFGVFMGACIYKGGNIKGCGLYPRVWKIESNTNNEKYYKSTIKYYKIL